MATALIDGDYLAYAASAACEKRYYAITTEGSTYVAPKVSELKQAVLSDNRQWVRSDVKEGATPESISQVRTCIRSMIGSWTTRAGCTDYKIYLSTYGSFRKDLAFSKEYKGQRKGHKPHHLEAAKRMLIADFGAINVDNHVIFYGKKLENRLEADDMLVVEAIRLGVNNTVVVTIDKDSLSQPVRTLRLCDNNGVVNGNCFGELTCDAENNIKGYGRKFLYYQILNGDTVDNYKLSYLSKLSFGEKGAYRALVDCNNDKQCWMNMVDVAQRLYPEPFEHTDHNGVTRTLDWLAMLNESLYMAKMVTKLDADGDAIINHGVVDILKSLSLDYLVE